MLKYILQAEGKEHQLEIWSYTKEWRAMEMAVIWANIIVKKKL